MIFALTINNINSGTNKNHKQMEINKLIQLLGISIIFFALSAVASGQESSEEPLDTIFRLGGRTMPVNVINVGRTDVLYKKPDDNTIFSIERKQIQKIVYKTGGVDVFNKPILEMIGEDEWESVWVTEKEKDVEGLYKYGTVKGSSPSSSRSKKAAKKNAIIIMQKKAVNMGGNVILITKAEMKGGYGEIPGYDMEAKVYGYNPPPEEEENE